jgi:hypothetical protein
VLTTSPGGTGDAEGFDDGVGLWLGDALADGDAAGAGEPDATGTGACELVAGGGTPCDDAGFAMLAKAPNAQKAIVETVVRRMCILRTWRATRRDVAYFSATACCPSGKQATRVKFVSCDDAGANAYSAQIALPVSDATNAAWRRTEVRSCESGSGNVPVR